LFLVGSKDAYNYNTYAIIIQRKVTMHNSAEAYNHYILAKG